MYLRHWTASVMLIFMHTIQAGDSNYVGHNFASSAALYASYDQDNKPIIELLQEIDKTSTDQYFMLSHYQQFVTAIRSLPDDIRSRIYHIALDNLIRQNKEYIKAYIYDSVEIWPGDAYWRCDQRFAFKQYGTTCAQLIAYYPPNSADGQRAMLDDRAYTIRNNPQYTLRQHDQTNLSFGFFVMHTITNDGMRTQLGICTTSLYNMFIYKHGPLNLLSPYTHSFAHEDYCKIKAQK